MKLGPLIPEVNILCVKLQDSRPTQSIFLLKNGTFLFQEYAFSLRERYPHFKILKCKLWGMNPPSPLDLHPCFQMSELRLSRLRGRGIPLIMLGDVYIKWHLKNT